MTLNLPELVRPLESRLRGFGMCAWSASVMIVAGTIVAGGIAWAVDRRVDGILLATGVSGTVDPTALDQIQTVIWDSVLGAIAVSLGVVVVVARVTSTLLRCQQIDRELLAERTAQAAALDRLGRLKSDLLNSVSHELRDPLSIVHGYAELLLARGHTFDADQIRQVALEMNRGSALMARIVDDLLDLSRIEQGRLRLQCRNTDLAVITRETIEIFSEQRGAERIVLDAPGPVVALADPVRVRQIVANLLSNALRYAPTGAIFVRVALECVGRAVIEVRDEGPGISPEAIPHLWEMYYRAPEVTDSPVGTGIGLALVKNLAEAHGGTVEAASERSRGATFRVHLPVQDHRVVDSRLPSGFSPSDVRSGSPASVSRQPVAHATHLMDNPGAGESVALPP